MDYGTAVGESESNHTEKRRKSSYRDTVIRMNRDTLMEEEHLASEGDVSADDVLDEEDEGQWFSMGMSKAERKETRKPWHLSSIIKLVSRSIGYQFMLMRLHSMWRIQRLFMFIDQSNDSFHHQIF